MNSVSNKQPTSPIQRFCLLALAGVVLAGAGDWFGLPSPEANAAERAPVSIDAAIQTDDTSLRSPRPRQPSSHDRRSAVADYTFDVNSNEIANADYGKAREVANRVREVPALRVALGGSNARRMDAVRDALIGAGIPSFKIQMDAPGDSQRQEDTRVAVLLID
jgi:outer membrane protein OmpA-like peptidoglycan-associated protein